MLLLELDVLHVDLVDAVDHGLDELHLGVAEPVVMIKNSHHVFPSYMLWYVHGSPA